MISLALENKVAYSCRVPMSKDATLFFPLTFSFWGQVEDSHIHLMTHWNFIFHAMEVCIAFFCLVYLSCVLVILCMFKFFCDHACYDWFIGLSVGWYSLPSS
jgi:hypothetical protein